MAKRLTPSTDSYGVVSGPTAVEPSVSYLTHSPQDSLPYEPVNFNQDLLRFADPGAISPGRIYTYLTRTGVVLSQPSPPSQQMVSEGVAVLNELLDIVADIGEPFGTEDKISICAIGVLGPVAWKATNAILNMMLHDRSLPNLESVSRAIFQQTIRPVTFPPTAADDALGEMLSGSGLRWEVVGLYCAQLGIYLGGEKDLSISLTAHKSWKSDRKTMMRKVYQACMQCESFCERIGAVNDLMLWFVMTTVLYATWCLGDDSYHVLRQLGDMTSVFLALGYHKGVPTDARTPTYLVQLRRIAAAWAHDHDKTSATFTSRPPRLSRHFCVLELPFDLPDSVLTGPAQELEQAILRLDENGWSNSNGKNINPVVRQRVEALLVPIREQALELKNGRPVPNFEAETRRVLLDLSSVWQSIPACLRYETAQYPESDDDYFLTVRSLRLEYLLTEFLLCTLLVNASVADHKKLISTAHEVLNLTLLPMRRRHLVASRRSDEEWSLVFYAMPCASVLVLELMRQAQHPEEELVPNRSSIIQDISVLISCCDSLTETGQNNYQICKQAQSIFSKSLDSILNPVGPVSELSSVVQPSEPSHYDQIAPESSELANGFSYDITSDWTAWLESVGLQPDPWLDSIMWPTDLTME